MLTGKLHARGLSRLMSVLFVVQIVVGGFCLLTTDAHAMPQSVQMHDAHCTSSCQAADKYSHDHSGNCYHCDQPERLSNPVLFAGNSIALVLSHTIAISLAQRFHSDVSGLFTARTPTGPPRSSSLLYTITQRIRV